MAKTFWSADFHFSHGNIIKYCNRPFLSGFDKQILDSQGGTWKGSNHRLSEEAISEMDSNIVDNVNSMVGEEDQLWFLGDFCFAHKNAYYQTARKYRDRIICKHVSLIMGNHDHHSISNLFEQVYDQTMVTVNGQRIMLNHYAMATWDGSHKGVWQLYGHSHTTIEDWMDKIMPERRSVDVGVDNAYRLFGKFRPFSFEDLQKLFANKKGHEKFHD